MVWLWLAIKAPCSRPSPRRGEEGNGKKQAEISGSGYGQFNRTANKRHSNNNDTEKDKNQKNPHNPQSRSPGPMTAAPEP